MWQSQFHSHLAVTTLRILPVLTKRLVTRGNVGGNATSLPMTADNYFREYTAANLLHGHIVVMLLSWIGAFSIYVMLDLAHSNLAYPAQLLFLGLHATGVVFGLAYNSQTPDLYPGSSHHSLGWVLTSLAVGQFLLRVLRSWSKSRARIAFLHSSSDNEQLAPLFPFSETGQRVEDEGPDHEREAGPTHLRLSTSSGGDGTSSNGTDTETLYDVALPHQHTSTDRRGGQQVSRARRWVNIVGSTRLDPILGIVFTISNIVLVILCFVAICTGIVTMAGIFRGNHIFNGIAHFIKGGIFFIYGIVTLSRWMGCFASLGWAWNFQVYVKPRWRTSVTMEGVESFLIFIYGVTNVFLEHLSAWGGAWAPQDFEHVAISLLFMGGGSCGMMLETKRLKGIVEGQLKTGFGEQTKTDLRPGYSINPLPAMLIFFLGTILGGHHQNSMESTMMHKWFGYLLTGAATARCVTYLLLYISPPTSPSPSRPPFELVTSFCLMSGGFMLMASNRDTVDAMIANGLNAMFVATITMGFTAALMAWCMVLAVIKAWAVEREDRYRLRKQGME